MTNAVKAGTTFTSKSDFLNVTTGITTVDFEGLTPPDTFASENLNNSTIGGVNFSNISNNSIIFNCRSLPSPYGNCDRIIPLVGPTTVAASGSPQNPITMSFPSNPNAVGVDLLPSSIDSQYTVTTSTGDSYSVTLGNNVSFVGFTSPTSINSLTIASNSTEVFDNVVYGSANDQAIPEPTTIGASLLALAALFGGKRNTRGN